MTSDARGPTMLIPSGRATHKVMRMKSQRTKSILQKYTRRRRKVRRKSRKRKRKRKKKKKRNNLSFEEIKKKKAKLMQQLIQ